MQSCLLRRQGWGYEIGVGLVLLAFWLVTAAYRGIDHDGVLYTFLALCRLHPLNFRHDLFVMFGSQAQFTVFPQIYAGLIDRVGLDVAAFTLTAAGQVLWLIAMVALLRKVVPGRSWILALACVVLYSHYYDSYRVFAYAEPFPTPRVFVEALCLFAFNVALSHRYWQAGSLLLLGVMLHPVMVLYTLMLVAVLIFLNSGRWRPWLLTLTLATTAVVVALALLQVSFFSKLFETYDPQWLSVVTLRSPFVLANEWDLDSFCRIAFLMVVLGVGWRLKVVSFARTIPVAVLCAAAMLLAWIVGCGMFDDPLITQLQTWRCLWLVQILALVVQGALLPLLWRGRSEERWLVGFLFAGALSEIWASLAYALCGLFAWWLIPRLPKEVMNRLPWRQIPYFIPLPQFLMKASLSYGLLMMSLAALTVRMLNVFFVAAGVVAVFVLVFWLWRGRRDGVSSREALSLGAGLICFVVGAMIWSAPFWGGVSGYFHDKELEQLQARIPRDAVVQSDKGIRWAWFQLQRSQYASSTQLAGVVFSRQNAQEGVRRMQRLHNAGMPGSSFDFLSKQPDDGDVRHSAEKIRTLCADPALDFLILKGDYAGAEIFQGRHAEKTSLFECRRLRSPA
jgi:hypothetical protein